MRLFCPKHGKSPNCLRSIQARRVNTGEEDILQKDQVYGEGAGWSKICRGQRQPRQNHESEGTAVWSSSGLAPTDKVFASSFLWFYLNTACLVNLWLSHQVLYQITHALSTVLLWVCHQPPRCIKQSLPAISSWCRIWLCQLIGSTLTQHLPSRLVLCLTNANTDTSEEQRCTPILHWRKLLHQVQTNRHFSSAFCYFSFRNKSVISA